MLTLALSFTILCIFYGKLLLHPGKTYFGASGDGMQIYYESIYHVKYDTQYWRQNSINYPYGESIFFTGAMPFINNLVKISGATDPSISVGLINLLMLFSPVIGALFLYAIFRHLRLPWHYGAVSATGIAFLSPQLGRFIGHYSLAWVFLIPAILYLLLRFYDYPSLKKSLLISFMVFLGATTHLYFLAFFLAIGGVYWAMLFFTNDRGFGRVGFVAKHASIQFLLPVVILQIIVKLSDHVTDRTQAPWGYLDFHSNKTGVFFPFNRPYEPLVGMIWKHSDVCFEGLCYVGMAAIFGLLAIVGVQLYRLFRGRFRLLLSVTDHKVLNIFFWTSLFLLWISFGNPFLGGREDWLIYLGPVRQFRAIGRFAWIFFYVMNIIAVYRLYKIAQRNKYLVLAIQLIIPLMLMYDMYYTIYQQEDPLNNRIAEMEDENNQLPQDVWLKNFKASTYQAILPLPYFHIGSENLCRQPKDLGIINCSYLVSIKTGLPMMGVISGRVSLSQTMNMLPLIFDPLRPIPVLKDLPDNRPLLLVVRPETLNENEKRILSLAKHIATSDQYSVYSVLPSEIAGIALHEYDSVKTKFDQAKKYQAYEHMTSDSAAVFAYNTYNSGKGRPYHGAGSYIGSIKNFNTLFENKISKTGDYVASFWMNNIGGDVYGRSQVEVTAIDSANKVPPFYFFESIIPQVVAVDGTWGLIQVPLTVPVPNAHVKISIWNYEMKPTDMIEVDDLLIRPVGTDIYQQNGDTIFMNNRTYFPLK